jgi:uncharacterized repeat protein (TIGR01451 family)
MRTKFTIAGLMVLGACLIGWAALALAQSPSMPDTGTRLVAPESSPSSAPLPLSTPGTLPTAQPVAPGSSGDPKPVLVEPKPISGEPEALGPKPLGTTVQPISGFSGAEDPTQPTTNPSNPVGRQEPAVSLEWIGPPTAKVGQPSDYTLVVKNVGNIPVQKVLVQVRMPQGITVNSSEPKCANENNILVWDLGTLMAKQEKNLLMKLQAVAKGDMMPQAWVTFTGSSVTRIRVCEPKLTLKASVNEKVMVGDTANFTLTVTNPGDGSADHVKIRAILSEGLEHPKGGSTAEFDIGNLAAGETRSVQLLCSTKGPGLQTCDAVAEAEGGLTAKDNVKLNVITPRLDLVLSGPGLRYLDRKAVYTIKVTNPGDAPATNVTVGDVVPDGFKVLAASDGGRHDFATRTVSWFLGEIAPAQTREVKFEVQAINVGDHKHKASVTGARGLRAEADLMTRVEGLSALLLEMVDTEDPIEVGGDTAYEIRVTNTGSKTETDIRLIAYVPDKEEFKNAQGPVKYHTEGKTIMFEPLEKLAPRADAIIRINVKALEAGTVRFKIQMTSTNLQEPVIKMEATRIYSDAPEGHSSSSPAEPQPLQPGGQLPQ